VRARGGAWRDGTAPGSDSSSSPIRSREGDGPDRRDPPVSEGKGEGRKSGPRGVSWAGEAAGPRAEGEEERRRKEGRGPGRKEKKKERKRKRRVARPN
jgi:hypothetical protein